jgi:hypothetical protein
MNEFYLNHFTLDELAKFVFWSYGNAPTQRSLRIDYEELQTQFKALYLLTNKIIASSSYYYESELTRKITENFQNIFYSGEALFFIDENIKNFSRHGLFKIKKSPETLSAYNDKQMVITYGKKLDSIGIVLRRQHKSISEKMRYIWSKDIFSDDSYSLGKYIELHEENIHEDTVLMLSGLAAESHKDPYKKDFVWEYIEESSKGLLHTLSKGFKEFARRRLTEIYAQANAEVLNLQLDCTLADKVSKYDAKLFCECMKHLNTISALKNIDVSQLVALKRREELEWFRNVYFQLIDSVNHNLTDLKEALYHSFNVIQERQM